MRVATQLDYELRIRRAQLWLEEHAHEEVEPAQLARVAHFSPFHFHRVFRGMTGETVMQCVRRLRMETAARRLRHSDQSVTDIAFAAGFKSHEGFTRAFRRHFGEAPSAWRRSQSVRMKALVERAPLTWPEVRVRSRPTIDMVAMAHEGSFDEVGDVWARVLGAAGAAGLYTGREQLIGRYPDDPEVTPAGRIRYEVGLQIGPPRTLPEGFHHRVIPASRWAVALHEGSYATLCETYLRLVGGWFPQSGYALGDDACIEIYLNSPHDTAESELQTEVWAPVG